MGEEIIKVTDFTVEAVERRIISNFVEKHHYSHSVNGVQHIQCFALFKEGKFGFDKEMIGAAMYCYPSMPSTAKKYNPINPDRCWELRRFVCIDDTPKNTESYFISQCHKWIKQNTDIEVIVSFADLEEGHTGVIYKASNFHLYGQTGGGTKLMVDGVLRHNRSLNQSKRTFGRTLKRRYLAGDKDVYQVKPSHYLEIIDRRYSLTKNAWDVIAYDKVISNEKLKTFWYENCYYSEKEWNKLKKMTI